MKFQRFEDITAWQKAQDLAVVVYQLFSNNKDFRFRDQICAAAVPISNNIAEDFERNSDTDFCRFLTYALGSSSEVKSMLYLAQRLNYITTEQQISLLTQATEISKIINGLLRFLKK